jgi:hypothetical protein
MLQFVMSSRKIYLQALKTWSGSAQIDDDRTNEKKDGAREKIAKGKRETEAHRRITGCPRAKL